jgi:hypothetical protein
MNQREKFINAIKDCSLTKIDIDQMEVYAGMFTDDLASEVVSELYSLKAEYDALKVEHDTIEYKLEKAYEANKTNKPVRHGDSLDSIFELKYGEYWCSKLHPEDMLAFANQLDKNVTPIKLDIVYNYKYPSIASMIRSSFSWSNTEQGFEFWDQMVKRYGNDV